MATQAEAAIAKVAHEMTTEYAGPALARLAELREREKALYEEEHGLNTFDGAPSDRAVPPGIAEERAALVRRVANAAEAARQTAVPHARATLAALNTARLAHMGADLQKAAVLAQTTAPDLLVQQAADLAATDPAEAATRATAAKLTGKVKPSTLDAMSRAVEDALDLAVPERASALEAHRAAMAALTELTRAAAEAEMQANAAAGDRQAAAVGSIALKLAGRTAEAVGAREVAP
ncbi:MAG TPA: hypothetical protein VHR55_08005 [Candidatus Limnocylindria bacterium]|nr:hypothetical protein [Candidatus Limnocylindria bacterium]